LLASLGTRQEAPYKMVLTHGFVVDANGRKYSKSAKNYTPPDQILKQNGAELLRLWVAAEDYRSDISVSTEIMTRLTEAYRKIRNTARYLLGNLNEFSPEAASVPKEAFWEIDRWVLHTLQKLIGKVNKGYDSFSFHTIFHEINRFCTVDLSAIYLDILKDRLYTFPKNSPERLAAQQTLFLTITNLVRLMAPILSFTADEIWEAIPSWKGKEASVHLASFPQPDPDWIDEALAERWEKFWKIREEANKALEKARQLKLIGNSLEAKLVIFAEEEPAKLLQAFQKHLPDLFIVSQVELKEDELSQSTYKSPLYRSLTFLVKKAEGIKCDRCWNYRTSVGENATHPLLCQRCVEAVS
ncbi:MAG: class I tRNA ligase family protein, partial [bacterium]|nr:class I tRNA ligase family protein [bacterium]